MAEEQKEAPLQVCNRCGSKTREMLSIEAGMRLAISQAPRESTEIESIPNEVCKKCYSELTAKVSKGAQIRFEQRAREKNKQMLWKSRVNLIRQARSKMGDKLYTEAAVAYEKYLRVVEMAYDKPKGTLEPDVFGSTVKSKEITVLATVYWDLMRIYDSHPNYRTKMAFSAKKLRQFLPYSRVYADISKKATLFLAKSNNKDIVQQFLKDIKAERPKCFIATAAFEAPMAEEVQLLRKYRDQKLSTHRTGRILIWVYYRLSPPIAMILEKSSVLRKICRYFLRLFIGRNKKIS